MSTYWHKSAILYTLDVDTFADGNGDGWGDFEGLSSRLDYIAGLNVSCLWLQPFFPSPNRDDGYDITDYYSVHGKLGNLGDFVQFTQMARERGIRVVIDLVVNHTSIDHPWFQVARSDPNSKYHDYYVWSKEKPADAHEGMVFPGDQQSIWTWDEKAQMYYFHRFYSHQPDLNIANPDVRAEISKIIACWLQLGVSGFRVDALPFLIELKGIDQPGPVEPGCLLDEIRRYTSWEQGDAVLLAEANVPPQEVKEYFSRGERIHVIFNFWVNQHMFLALAREDARPIRESFEELPPIPDFCQWANFLRTHDELDLGRLTNEEREEVFQAFAPDEGMRLYGRGIRRRLAPMLGNDRRRLEMVHSLVLTLPGTPVLRYGDEIGMGDDLKLEDRKSVRTPMQWSDAENGGFSTADESELFLPVVSEGEFSYHAVNVARQQRDSGSLLNWIERAIRFRRRCPEFGSGRCDWLDVSDHAVLAHRCSTADSACMALHNLSSRAVRVKVNMGQPVEKLYDVLCNTEQETGGQSELEFDLGPYGYRWYRLDRAPETPEHAKRKRRSE